MLFRATPCARLGIDTERRESIESSTYCRIPILKLPVITESRRVVAWEPENTRKDVRERGGRRHRKRSEGGVPSHRSLSAPLPTRIGGGGRNMRQSSWRPPLAGKKNEGEAALAGGGVEEGEINRDRFGAKYKISLHGTPLDKPCSECRPRRQITCPRAGSR